MSARSEHRFEIGQGLESKIHFAGRSAEFVTIDLFEKIIRQVSFFDHLYESQSRIDARRDNVGVDLIAALEDHTLRFAVLHHDLRDRSLSADFNSSLARRVRDGVGHSASPAACKSPRPEG